MPGIPVATEIAQSQTHEAGSTESKGIGSQARSEQAEVTTRWRGALVGSDFRFLSFGSALNRGILLSVSRSPSPSNYILFSSSPGLAFVFLHSPSPRLYFLVL